MLKKKFTTKQIILTGMLAAIAGVLMSWEIPLPLMPPFYKFDFSLVPSIVGLFLMGPVEGALIEIIKLIIKLILSGTNSMYVGELVNLMSIILFTLPTWFVYKKLGANRKAAIIALMVGICIKTGAECFSNAYISLPLYAKAMKISVDEIVKSVQIVNSRITSLQSLIIYATIPFNLFKLIVNGTIGYVIYDRLLSAMPEVSNLRSSQEA
jgi:riboflavin transporter FmnP